MESALKCQGIQIPFSFSVFSLGVDGLQIAVGPHGVWRTEGRQTTPRHDMEAGYSTL